MRGGCVNLDMETQGLTRSTAQDRAVGDRNRRQLPLAGEANRNDDDDVVQGYRIT